MKKLLIAIPFVLTFAPICQAQIPSTAGEGLASLSVSGSGFINADFFGKIWCTNTPPPGPPAYYRAARVTLYVDNVVVYQYTLEGLPLSPPMIPNVGPVSWDYQLSSGYHEVLFEVVSRNGFGWYGSGTFSSVASWYGTIP